MSLANIEINDKLRRERDALEAQRDALLAAAKALQLRLDQHFGGDHTQDWKEQAKLRQAIATCEKE